jgi:hypothetical protein
MVWVKARGREMGLLALSPPNLRFISVLAGLFRPEFSPFS